MTKKLDKASEIFSDRPRPQRLSEYVYKALSEAIVEGKLSPGERLREINIAEALSVSRTPVREALFRLKQQKLVSGDTSGAYYVAEWDRKTLWELSTLRAALESLAFSLAPQYLVEKDFEYLEGIVHQMEEYDDNLANIDYKKIAQIDFKFHAYIWKRTGHALLEQALDNIKPQAQYYMYVTRQAGQQDYAERHKILIEFLKNGDRNKVNEIMLDHIMQNAEKTIAWWEHRQEDNTYGIKQNIKDSLESK